MCNGTGAGNEQNPRFLRERALQCHQRVGRDQHFFRGTQIQERRLESLPVGIEARSGCAHHQYVDRISDLCLLGGFGQGGGYGLGGIPDFAGTKVPRRSPHTRQLRQRRGSDQCFGV